MAGVLMTSRLYIDPGKHFHAQAHFEDGRLTWVDFESVETCGRNYVTLKNLASLVIEKPVLRGANGKDPNDCVDVFGAACLTEGYIRALGGPAALYVIPEDWKGAFKKPPHHRKVWAELSPDEREVFARDAGHEVDEIRDKIEAACQRLARTRKVSGYSWKAHNLLDAVGLGLWHLGRLHTGRMVSPLWLELQRAGRVAKV
jgi:hypothetical protein